MNADLPVVPPPLGQVPPSAPIVAEAPSGLPLGQILFGQIQTPSEGLPAGTFLLYAEGRRLLVRTAALLRPGEGVAFELSREGGREVAQILARSGEGGGPLELLGEGRVRPLPGVRLEAPLRALLSGPKPVVVGEVLSGGKPGIVPVRVEGLEVSFRYGGEAPRPGDLLFLRPRETGGGLRMQVFARGGPFSQGGTAEAASRMDILRPLNLPARGTAPKAVLTPGTILTGRLLRLVAPPSPEGRAGPGSARPAPSPAVSETAASATTSAPPAAPAAGGAARRPAAAPAGPEAGREEGSPGRANAPAPPALPASAEGSTFRRTAVLQFPGLEVEVPFPEAAVRDFSLGDPLRVLVRRAAPRLELELLPPRARSAPGASRWMSHGGAGERVFGPRLAGLAEVMTAVLARFPDGLRAEAAEGVLEALGAVVLQGEKVPPERVRRAILREGLAPEREGGPEQAPQTPTLHKALSRFLEAVRGGEGGNDPALRPALASADRAMASLEFLQTANGLRQFLDQGLYIQLPFVMGGERGTLDLIVRRQGEGKKGRGSGRDNYLAVFFLELKGLGPLRIEAALSGDRLNVRFTTPSKEVGVFLEKELPRLREEVERQDLVVEGLSWMLGRAEPEPLVPSSEEGPIGGEDSYINVVV